MALDALMYKSIAVNSAATFYPTGPIQYGGSNVDEFDLFTGENGGKGVFSTPLAVVVFIAAAPTGTSPTLDVTVESDDNTGFSSPQTRLTGKQITGSTGRNSNGSGPYLIGWLTGIPERYVRVKLVAGGTTPDFGTVGVGLLPAASVNTLY